MLRSYEHGRQAETMRMLSATDALFRLFIGKGDLTRSFRDMGLGIINRYSAARNAFSRSAAGWHSASPPLLQPFDENSV